MLIPSLIKNLKIGKMIEEDPEEFSKLLIGIIDPLIKNPAIAEKLIGGIGNELSKYKPEEIGVLLEKALSKTVEVASKLMDENYDLMKEAATKLSGPIVKLITDNSDKVGKLLTIIAPITSKLPLEEIVENMVRGYSPKSE